jgi:uncharacterized protein YmfQ (DUF2313 family)
MANGHADLLKLLLPAVAYDKTGIALTAEIQAEGAQLDAFAAFIEALMDEIDPRTTTELLAAWERVYGLPDACGGADVSAPIDQRRAALGGKVAAIGGLSRAYFLDLATKLGYTDTAISRSPLVTCESSCESPVRDDPRWRFVWQVNLSTPTLRACWSASFYVSSRRTRLSISHTKKVFHETYR